MNFFRNLDLFPKLQEDVVQAKRSVLGACIFILTLCIMGSLMFSEVNAFLFGVPDTEPFISKSDTHERIRVNLNMSFYQIPCSAISLDYQDITGSHFEDVQQTLHKLRLSSDGSHIDQKKVLLVKKIQQEKFAPSYPMMNLFKKKLSGKQTSCYGAELYQGQKCLTCQDVLWAYIMRSWPAPPLEQVAQCQSQMMSPKYA